MMKILMVQLPTSHLGAGEKVYPLGLARLAALVPGHMEKQVLDMNLSGADPWSDLARALEACSPDLTVLSFRNLDPLAGHQASYLSSLKTAAALVKTLAPGTRILAGGPAFTMFAARLMAEVPGLDWGIAGEGEIAFPMVLDLAAGSGAGPDAVPGLVWRDRDRIVENPPGQRISMDEVPFPDTGLFRPESYTKANAYVAAMGIEGKRGCDLACAYCRYPFLGGGRMRLRRPGNIADDMERLYKENGIGLFHFTDGVVNRPADHFEAVCQELIQRNLPIAWTGFFREDSLTRENLNLAKRAGLCAVYFSGDALNQRGLDLLNKQLTLAQILEASRVTVAENMLTMCHFLVNLPGESPEDIQESRRTLDALLEIHHGAGNLGAVIFNHVRLYPGAPLTRRLIRQGALDPDIDLLYPVYHNPAHTAHILHDFEAHCHRAGVFSHLNLAAPGGER